jgi:hypothetical protein
VESDLTSGQSEHSLVGQQPMSLLDYTSLPDISYIMYTSKHLNIPHIIIINNTSSGLKRHHTVYNLEISCSLYYANLALFTPFRSSILTSVDKSRLCLPLGGSGVGDP